MHPAANHHTHPHARLISKTCFVTEDALLNVDQGDFQRKLLHHLLELFVLLVSSNTNSIQIFNHHLIANCNNVFEHNFYALNTS